MSFIRKKKICGQDYAYLVTNSWTEKGSRQKAKYLGKVLRLPINQEMEFSNFILQKHQVEASKVLGTKTKDEIIHELIAFELAKRGFKEEEIEVNGERKNLLTNQTHYFKDKKLCKIKNHKEVILELNEGFLCNYSLEKLLTARITGYDEREQGIKLAKALLEAGIKADKDLFVALFEKWEKSGSSAPYVPNAAKVV